MSDGSDSVSARPARWRWGVAFGVGLAIASLPAPSGIAVESWRLFAVFAATVAGLITQPAPGGFVVLLGVAAIALFGIMPIQKALAGYADPIVWLVLTACLMSRGMIRRAWAGASPISSFARSATAHSVSATRSSGPRA